MKKKILIFTFTPHQGFHMTLPGRFTRRGLHAVELAVGEKVLCNIFGDADVHHQIMSVIIFAQFCCSTVLFHCIVDFFAGNVG